MNNSAKVAFGVALAHLKAGGRVSREGWNGKGMWLELQVPDEHSKMSLPYVYMYTADGNLVPWLASQTDLLADDWNIVAANTRSIATADRDTCNSVVEASASVSVQARTIKPEDIEGYIAEEHYLNMGEVLGLPANHQTRVITQCVLVLKNGYTVTGESGCADPAKYNKEIGERIARANAISKVWPLMGYVLRSQLAGMTGLID